MLLGISFPIMQIFLLLPSSVMSYLLFLHTIFYSNNKKLHPSFEYSEYITHTVDILIRSKKNLDLACNLQPIQFLFHSINYNAFVDTPFCNVGSYLIDVVIEIVLLIVLTLSTRLILIYGISFYPFDFPSFLDHFIRHFFNQMNCDIYK